jgi:hypothetical protein
MLMYICKQKYKFVICEKTKKDFLKLLDQM